MRDHVQKGDCVLEFVDTKNQLADIFTKPLPNETFFAIRRELGLFDINDLNKYLTWLIFIFFLYDCICVLIVIMIVDCRLMIVIDYLSLCFDSHNG